MDDRYESLRLALRGRYDLREELGVGGMGAVFLADDLKHHRRVAVKTVRSDLPTEAIAARFEREIRITAGLQHPHILPLLDSGVADDSLFYVMPHVPGESLRDRLNHRGPLSVEDAVLMACDVAEGLEHAHAQGVIHRDIKPENILLADEYALILDFGIAKALADREDGHSTRTGALLGSPVYMAPEQFFGAANPRTDIYALGCVLHEAVTGRSFTSLDDRTDWGDVPPGLRAIIERAASQLPEERFADIASFRRALQAEHATHRRRPRTLPHAVVAVAIVVGALLTATFPPGRSRVPSGTIESIAVLPLVNLTGDPNEEYFVAGVHEAFISELSRLRDLRVISRTSVSRYATTQLSIREIADELGVTALIEGGVRRVGDRVRVDVRLIDALADRHLWVESYDERLTAENLFSIQKSLAGKVATALEATLDPRVAGPPPTASLEAYDLYARGRYLYNRFSSYEDRERALDLFRASITADSNFALAYVGLAEAYSFLGGQSYLPADEAIPLARSAAERALSLDETLAEAHAALGGVLTSERRFQESERAFRRAIELDPSAADVRRQYGRLLNRLGRMDESVREARLAVDLDPLSLGNRVSLASRLFFARDFRGAIVESQNVLELEPEDPGALFFLGGAYVFEGRYGDGIAALQKVWKLEPGNPFRATFLAWAYARSDRTSDAVQLLAELDPAGPLLKEFAIVYGELGELDLAFEYLERARDEDPRSLASLRTDPTADSLRRDARFEAWLTNVGL